MKLLKPFIGIFIVLVLSYWTIQPLFLPGFFPMHDDTQPTRVYEMKKALSEGQFPVRWVSDLGYGYGYPIFNFYAPLAYYVGAGIALLGIEVMLATKIMMALGVIISAISMYMLGKELFGESGGIVAAIAYVYAPYHALDIYVRGDVAEYWAYACIPFVFYGIWKYYEDQKWRFIAVGSLSFAALILSHNLTAFMTAPFISVFTVLLCILAYKKKKNIVKGLILILVLGISISAFYWIPTLMEMNYTNVLSQVGGGADFKDHFVCYSQLWTSVWGYGGSTSGCVDGMSFKVGKIHLVLSTVTIFLALLTLLRKMVDTSYVLNPKGILFVCTAIGFLISIILTLGISQPFWESIPLMSFFQYPWRFLLLTSFFASLLCGFFVWLFIKSISIEYHSKYMSSYGITIGIVLVLIVVNQKLFIPRTNVPKTAEDYISEQAIKWNISKISDEYLPRHFDKPENEHEIVKSKFSASDENAIIKNSTVSTTYASAVFDVQEFSDINVNIAYFPSWKIFVDGKEKNFTITGKGMTVKVPPGRHLIEVKLSSTFVQRVANTLSLIGIGGLFIGIISSIKRKVT